MSYELHYCELKYRPDKSKKIRPEKMLEICKVSSLDEVITVHEFDQITFLVDHIVKNVKYNGCVYLVSVCGEEFVTDDKLKIAKFINDSFIQIGDIISVPGFETYERFGTDNQIHLFECRSYEEAYKEAVYMNEDHPLCYTD